MNLKFFSFFLPLSKFVSEQGLLQIPLFAHGSGIYMSVNRKLTFAVLDQKKIFQRSTVNTVKQDLYRLALIVYPSPRVT